MSNCRFTNIVICTEGTRESKFNGTFKLFQEDSDDVNEHLNSHLSKDGEGAIPDKSNERMIYNDQIGFIASQVRISSAELATESPPSEQNSWVNRQPGMTCMLGGAFAQISP